MHRSALLGTAFVSGLLLLGAGCRTTPWRTSDAEDHSGRWQPRDGHYAFSEEPLPEPEPEPKKTTELSLAYARWMEGVGSLIEARRHYQEVVDEHPEHVDALLGLARIDQLSGRTQEAEQGFLAALRVQPDSAVVLYSLGKFYESQERWSEAAGSLNKAMLAAPTEEQYRYDLAVSLVHTGNVRAAETQFVRCVGDAAAHYNIGLILHEMGQTDAAEQQMLMAVTKEPNLQNAQYWLDEIHREREAGRAMQESLADSGSSSAGMIQQTSHEAPATTARAPRSGHSVDANPPAPTRMLTPQQLQQFQNQR
jgi:tetratricopeptide (TPR) repeat protein